MKILCYECGQKYSIDESKIKEPYINVKCKKCGFMIKVTKPETVSTSTFFDDPSDNQSPPSGDIFREEKTGYDESIKIPGISIRTKITLTMLTLVLISLMTVGSIASFQSRKALSAQVETHLRMNSTQKAGEYGLVFERIQNESGGIAEYAAFTYGRSPIVNDMDFRVLMPWDGNGYEPESVSEEVVSEIRGLQRIGASLKTLVKNNPYLILGYMGTDTGLTVFNDEATIEEIHKIDGYIVHQRPWYIDAKKAGRTIWTKPYVDANTKKLVITCATPVYSSEKQLLGVIGFDVLLETILKDILKIDIGYDSYAILVGFDGKVLVRPGMDSGDSRWDKTYESDNLMTTSNAGFNAIIGQMVLGRNGLETYSTDKEEKYIAYAPLPVINASLAIIASKNKVIQPATTIQNLIIIITVVVLLISVMIGFFLGSSITRPMITLASMANLISTGEKDLEVIDDKRKDEIGVLTQSINRLVMSLKLAMKR